MRRMSVPLIAARLAEKVASGAYVEHFPLHYSVYRGPAGWIGPRQISRSDALEAGSAF